MKPHEPRVRMKSAAMLGEIIQIKSKIRHPMETGWRRAGDGSKVPRNRITKFVCTFEGKEVMSADYSSGVAADPYLLFHTKVTGPGTYRFRWEADGGDVYATSTSLEIIDA